MTDRDGVIFKVNGIPLQAKSLTPAQSIKCTEQNREFQLGSFGDLEELVFLLDPCSLVFGSCTQPLTRLAGGRFVCCAGKLRGSHLPVKTLGLQRFCFAAAPLSGMDKPGLREAGLYAYAFSARDFLYFSLSQLAMNFFAASPMVESS